MICIIFILHISADVDLMPPFPSPSPNPPFAFLSSFPPPSFSSVISNKNRTFFKKELN